MKDTIVKLKTDHAAMVADKKSDKKDVRALAKEIATLEKEAGRTNVKDVPEEVEPVKE